jgi:hypothetical protein
MVTLRGLGILLIAGCGVTLPQSASATFLSSWLWSSTINGVAVSGTANFDVDPSSHLLTITLTNNSGTLVTSESQILESLYFDVRQTSDNSLVTNALTMQTAIANAGLLDNGTSLQTSPTNGTANSNICAASAGNNKGLSACASTVTGGWVAAFTTNSSGFGTNRSGHWGIGTEPQGNGSNAAFGNVTGNAGYGLAPTAGVNPTGGSNLSGDYPPGFVYQVATFTLSGLTTSNVYITNVAVGYGTSPTLVAAVVPEPGAFSMIAGVALLLAGYKRCRRS